MIRIIIFASLVFVYGEPAFDGMRPGILDEPLTEINRGIKSDVRQSVMAMSRQIDLQSMPGGKAYAAGMKDFLR